MDKQQDLLTWEGVHAWAESLPDNEPAGEVCDPDACPLANYLTKTTGRAWSVGFTYATDDSSHVLAFELWAKNVRAVIDEQSVLKPLGKRMFLAILDECKPEEVQGE